MTANPDNIAGNHYNKYAAGNPIARLMMRGFMTALDDMVSTANVSDLVEIGCGEGFISHHLAEKGMHVLAGDVSAEVVEHAKFLHGHALISYDTLDIYNLEGKVASNCPLIVCCEVLEHLPDPALALQRLADLEPAYLLLSVPREPIWRMLNMARFRYWPDRGNTPGHIQHWSHREFIEFVSSRFDIIQTRQPIPWTMVLCKQKS